MKIATIVAIIAIAGILVIAFGVNYFSLKEFYFDGHKYRAAEEHDQQIRYRSNTGSPILVQIHEVDRILTLDGQHYHISVEDHPYGVSYQVTYPNGVTYRVMDQNRLMAYDENGEWITNFTIVADNQGNVMRLGDKVVHPTQLVVAAYPQYQQQRGYPVLYYLSLILFVLGWCSYRYEAFQKVMFWASLKWIWTENPEPSEFYFFMSKVGGILTMLLAFVLFLQSLVSDFVLLPL